MPSKEQHLAKANKPAEIAMRLHPFYRGKVQISLKCPIRDFDDFAVWYTPGVAAPCRAIYENAELAYSHTNKANTIAIVSLGGRLAEAMKAADILESQGLSTTVADARFAKPLDADLILRLAGEHEALITIEEGSVGGFGSHVLDLLASTGRLDDGLAIRTLALPDRFIDQDRPEAMYHAAGLDAEAIVARVFEALGRDSAGAAVQRA